MAGTGAAESLFERLGGRQAVSQIVDAFYSSVETDGVLRPIYPADLSPGREKLKLFFEQWLGGEDLYSQRFGHPRLRIRHFAFVIDEIAADLWLGHMRAAMEAAGVASGDLELIFERLAPLARHMVNAGHDVPRGPLRDPYLQ